MKLYKSIRRRNLKNRITLQLEYTDAEYEMVQKLADEQHATSYAIISGDDHQALAFFRSLHYWLWVIPTMSKEDQVNHAIHRKHLEEVWNARQAGQDKRVRRIRKRKGTAKGVDTAGSSVEKKGKSDKAASKSRNVARLKKPRR